MFKRVGLSLVPVDKWGREALAQIKDGALVFCNVRNSRNMAQHRKYFAIINGVFEATGRWTSREHLRRDVLIGIHRYDEYVNQFTGEVTKVPHSMKVESMPRAEFERLYTDTMQLLADEFDMTPAELEDFCNAQHD